MIDRSFSIRLTTVALAAVMSGGLPAAAQAQWSTTYEQFYLPGKFNWKFRHNYPAAERLFNAFDYGHAILYEKLWTKPDGARSILEGKQYDFITRQLLVHPPNVALEESAIEVAYAKLAPEAKAMFDWAHLLHRQIYDVWADESMIAAARDAKVQELIRYYKTRPDLAFSSMPKTMELMEGQPYSTAFRKNYPKFNGLIWAYHWLQVGLYEPLVTAKTLDEKQAGVLAAVARFKQMLIDPPASMPYIMPMTGAVAPEFAKRYPEAAIIFDNLHSMHDVVSDILANPSVPRDQKRSEILKAARRYRDATSFVQSTEEWQQMTEMMGVENMGGPAVGFLPALPAPTVERGAVMAGMDHANMPGIRRKEATGAAHGQMKMPGDKDSPKVAAMDHDKMQMAGMAKDSMSTRTQRSDSMAGADHSRMSGMTSDSTMGGMDASRHEMMQLHMRMMADSVIRRRMMADTAMHRLMQEMMRQMPPEQREHMESMMHSDLSAATTDAHHGHDAMASPTPKAASSKKRSANAGSMKPKTTTGKSPTKGAKKDSTGKMPGMDHGKMPGMKKKP